MKTKLFLHLNTGCQDTLYANVSCTSDDGCGITALSPLTLTVDDCNGDAQFCVSVLATDLPTVMRKVSVRMLATEP